MKVLADNAVYRGLVSDQKRNGGGIMVYGNGRIYEGQWLDNLRHGLGFEKYLN